ncbi:hypothetical protein ACFY1U_07270 [Streptomyces sp. NPDC001351]|uniref:hypothetical protein n=1 Tax=Streptomyces sp. NPDC001351 TaxID=3364564 RepID=UPI0036A1C1CD
MPSAALRVMRTAAGRRALQVVVLVGGLFALGFLCGQQAHAAEGAPSASSSEILSTAPADGVRASLTSDTVATVTRLTDTSAATAGRPASTSAALVAQAPRPRPDAPGRPEPTRPAAPAPAPAPVPASTDPKPVPNPAALPETPGAAGQALTPLAGELVRSVGDRVVQPVGGLVESVTAGLGRATAQLPPLSSLPSLPGLPGSPSMPGLPGLPGFPPSPGQILPAPVAQAPQPGVAGHSGLEGAVDDRRSAAAASGTAYGPRFVVDATAGDATAVRGGGRRAAGAGYAPARQAPDGDPAGVPANRAAVDNGTPRHGDAHAVALNHRPFMRLVSGAAVRAAAAGTRDRHRDIPVFPG